jgi:hypothetical protein
VPVQIERGMVACYPFSSGAKTGVFELSGAVVLLVCNSGS